MARKPIKYELEADADGFKRGAKQAEQALRGIERQAKETEDALDLKVDVDDSAIAVLRRRLLAARAQLENDIQINPDVDTAQALTQLRTFERQLKSLDRLDVQPEVTIDRDGNLTRFAQTLPELATGLSRVASSGWPAAAGVAALALAAGQATAAIGLGLGGGLVAALVGKGGYSLLGAYDQIEKANKRFDTVFGDQAGTITEWARELGFATGQGTEAVKGSASLVQDLLVPRGFSRKKASTITQSIVERGAALAEWSNGKYEAADATDILTKAVLGEYDGLKQLGIAIDAADVKRRTTLLRGQDAYKGLNDKQLEVIATQQLIEEGSVDAWKAYKDGTEDAGEALRRFSAVIANVKTDAIAGFGSIFAEIVTDLVGGAKGLEEIDLAGWIEKNRDSIRESMLAIVEIALVGADAFVQFAQAVLGAVENVGPALGGLIRGMGVVAEASERFAAVWRFLNTPVTDIGMWKEAWAAIGPNDTAENAAKAAAEVEAAFRGLNAAPAINELGKLRDGIGTTLNSVRDLKQIEDEKFILKLVLDAGMADMVEARLKGLSDDQIATIIAQADRPSATKTDKEIGAIAKKERKARIKVSQSGANTVEQAVKDAARDRTATVFIKYKGYKIPQYLARPGLQSDNSRALVGEQMFYPVPKVAVGRMGVSQVGNVGVTRTSGDGGLTVQFFGNLIDPDGAARAMEKAYREHRQRVGA